MKPLARSLAVAVLQCLIAFSIPEKYAMDRSRLPRAWALALPNDPNLPLRGRYVRLRLRAELPQGQGCSQNVALSAVNGRLFASPSPDKQGSVATNCADTSGVILREPVAFFIPDNVADPSRRRPGEELWVEVSIPSSGPPRPIQLGVKKDGGTLAPLHLR